MNAMKAVYGLWANIQIGQLNKLLKPFGCRLVKKTSKDWGNAVSITAHALEAVVPKTPLTAGTAGVAGAGLLSPVTACEHVWSNGSDFAVCEKCGVQKHPEIERV